MILYRVATAALYVGSEIDGIQQEYIFLKDPRRLARCSSMSQKMPAIRRGGIFDGI